MSATRKAAVAGLLTGATAIGLAPIFVRLSETGSTVMPNDGCADVLGCKEFRRRICFRLRRQLVNE